MFNRIGKTVMIALVLIIAAGSGALFADGGRLAVGSGIGATTFDGETVGTLGLQISAPVRNWLDITLSGTAVHTLERGYTGPEGTYQAETAWTALGLRPHIRIGERLDIGFPVSSGSGILRFRYEEPHRSSLTWTEEVLDQVTFWTQSIGADLRFDLSEKLSVSAEGGLRFTSPLRTPLADDGDLSGWYAGAGVGYRL